jgi:carbon-monoxide dehydrogenase large subunit
MCEPSAIATEDTPPDSAARPFARREDARLLTGRGRFVSDIQPFACLHLVVVRSDAAGPASLAVDAGPAVAAPGVVLVLTGEDLAGLGRASVNTLGGDFAPHPFAPLARTRVDHVGQPVAAVVAQSRADAEEAAALVEVATGPREPPETVTAFAADWEAGPTEAGAREAEISLDIAGARVAPSALEPRAVVAEPDGAGGLTVWVTSQSAHRVRSDLAAILGLPAERLRVIAPDVGGAFGAKASIHPEDVLVAEAARRLGRPVRWTGTRSSEFTGGTHGRGARIRARALLDEDGAVAALSVDADVPLGAWTPFSAPMPARNIARIVPGPYRLPRVAVSVRARLGPEAPVGIYRGAGRPEAALVMERVMDLAARQSGADPIAFRRRHLAPPEEYPRRLPSGSVVDSADCAGLLDTLEAAADYPRLKAEVAAARAAGRLEGLGVALYIEPCGQGWESARARLLPDGRIEIATGCSTQGQGRETAYARIAAEATGLPAERIDVIHSDTALVPEGIGAYASRGTAIGGAAVLRAAQTLRANVATALGRDPAPDDWTALAAGADAAALTVELRHEAEAETWASGAVLARVAIDRDTGLVTPMGIIWVDDAGSVIEPVLVKGQLVGGLAQGLGEALMERLVWDDDGQLLTGSFMDYALPRAADMPPVDLVARPRPSKANPLGARGVGEAGCIGVPAALVNAAVDALSGLGIEHLDMPLTPHRVWQAMRQAGL